LRTGNDNINFLTDEVFNVCCLLGRIAIGYVEAKPTIKEAADVLRPINPDILLLQEVRDYDACAPVRRSYRAGNLSCRQGE